ncbi:MAG: pyruvate:ferredoxin (flavodoxin) oxidoreductase [Verrucomicrobiaceae bacterium]|nr:pyruvate:ferredoxin (flavodoxin) oxidoreductase [Verrucomicrobiaceae bacterium]
MKSKNSVITDGNEAVASIAFRASETIAIYPITPSSPMAESCEEWAVKGKKNIWGFTPSISQLQSEGGVAGAVHGALQTGTLMTTFTASQGLLLMVPNMYKIAGELTSFVMHVSARALAHHGLSIFGDHTDVMACRQTGFAMLCSNSAQEAHDMALISHAATLISRVPVLHFFDGFRTSHEINTYEMISDDIVKEMLPYEKILEIRDRSLTTEKPFIRGTAQNTDVYFQSWEARNPYYTKCAEIFAEQMEKLGKLTGRTYKPYEYFGAEDAEEIIVLMGSGAETVEEVVKALNAQGKKYGVLKVRMYRPFSVKMFIDAIPQSVKKITVLDRTKELGAMGEPLYQEVVASVTEARNEGFVARDFDPVIIGGRYALGSKDFTPAMVKGVFDNMSADKPKNHFSVGINDDVSNNSISYDESFKLEDNGVLSAVFFGLGADGTVGANKNTIKIIGNETPNYAQAYFVYDSKKSGGLTVSHLRFGANPIKAPYLVNNAQFVGCHQFSFMEKYNVLGCADKGAVFLLNSIYDAKTVWNHLNKDVQQTIIDKQLQFYVIDAYKVAKSIGMGGRINTIMQTCYFAISGVLPKDEAIAKIKAAAEKTYGKKGPKVVEMNFAAIDASVANLEKVEIPTQATAAEGFAPAVPDEAPDFVKRVTAVMMREEGDKLPVSAFPVDGTWPAATTQWEKRNIAIEVPSWNPDLCIQCTKCATICPHAAIRAKFYPNSELENAPEGFKKTAFRPMPKDKEKYANYSYTIQIAPEDCTGCGLCASVCPAKSRTEEGVKALMMVAQEPIRETEKKNFKFFLDIPNPDRLSLGTTVKDVQFRQPLFEFSGSCAGCGETPYVRTLTQLFGDRLFIANATGCSSIYGGNLPTTPYCVNQDGRGPAWANSLFEDNAEFGFGFRISLDMKEAMAKDLIQRLAGKLGDDFVKEILTADQSTEAGVIAQRARVVALKDKLAGDTSLEAQALKSLADDLVNRTVWIIGGDGWAYDIGYGGLDHVLASGKNVNIMVMDTEVYSNTGGQQSKATPIGAIAKFATQGKSVPKKDLGMLAVDYGNVYVAQIALGANDAQAIKAMAEADSYEGSSLIIAYSHCINHGYNLINGPAQQKAAVDSGYWPLYRYDPRRIEQGLNPFQLDSKDPKLPVGEYMKAENRFGALLRQNPERAAELTARLQNFVDARWAKYKYLAERK